MRFPDEIKRMRQRCFLSQQDFDKEIKGAYSTVHRWEGGKAKPSLHAMENIKEFCLEHDACYSDIEDTWLDFEGEGNG